MRFILLGAFTVGTLDALDAIIFFGIRNGVQASRIFQSIASGWLGRDSFKGGAPAVALGVASHYTVALGIVLTYFIAARQFRLLRDRPLLCAPVFGVLAYLTMNFVVIPLSQANRGSMAFPIVANGVLIHIFGVGIPAAWFAAKAARERAELS